MPAKARVTTEPDWCESRVERSCRSSQAQNGAEAEQPNIQYPACECPISKSTHAGGADGAIEKTVGGVGGGRCCCGLCGPQRHRLEPRSRDAVFHGGRCPDSFARAVTRSGQTARALHGDQRTPAGECNDAGRSLAHLPRATLAQARRVHGALPGPKTLELFPGLKHGSCYAAEAVRWTNSVDGFLRTHGAPSVRLVRSPHDP